MIVGVYKLTPSHLSSSWLQSLSCLYFPGNIYLAPNWSKCVFPHKIATLVKSDFPDKSQWKQTCAVGDSNGQSFMTFWHRCHKKKSAPQNARISCSKFWQEKYWWQVLLQFLWVAVKRGHADKLWTFLLPVLFSESHSVSWIKSVSQHMINVSV